MLNLRHIPCIDLVRSRNKILSSFTHSYVIKHIKYGKWKFKRIDVLYVCALIKNILIFVSNINEFHVSFEHYEGE